MLESLLIPPTFIDLVAHDTWTNIPMIIPSQQSLGAALVGEDLYMFGGLTSGDTLWKYNLKTNVSTQLKSAPALVSGHCFNYIKGKLYSCGDGNTANSKLLMSYDIASDNWTTLPAVPFYCRQSRSTDDGTLIYYFGGNNGVANNDLYSYDPEAGLWTNKPNTLPKRTKHSLNIVDNKLYMYGGTDENNKYLNSIWSYDISTGTETQLTSASTVVSQHCSIVAGNKIYTYGGWDGTTFLVTLKAYDIIQNSWTVLAPSGRRQNAAALYYESKMLVTGGYPTDNMLWIYQI